MSLMAMLMCSLGRANAWNDIYRISWTNMHDQLAELVPPLSEEMHKGQAGRIGVIGGSIEYTGAPYYAAMSALRAGGDLTTVLCANEAAAPIKSYSPELMVRGIYTSHVGEELDENREAETETCSNNGICDTGIVEGEAMKGAGIVNKYISRLHVLVLGPGLGRSGVALRIASKVVPLAQSRSLPLVIDADALFMLTQGNNLDFIRGNHDVVLTPNRVEFERLLTAADIAFSSCDVISEDGVEAAEMETSGTGGQEDGTATELGHRAMLARRLANSLGGVTVLLKGRTDIITCGTRVIEVVERGSPRRVGGQGDILAGILGVSLHWAKTSPRNAEGNRVTDFSEAQENSVKAAAFASILTRRSSALAYKQYRRAVSSIEIVNSIGEAFDVMIPADDTPCTCTGDVVESVK